MYSTSLKSVDDNKYPNTWFGINMYPSFTSVEKSSLKKKVKIWDSNGELRIFKLRPYIHYNFFILSFKMFLCLPCARVSYPPFCNILFTAFIISFSILVITISILPVEMMHKFDDVYTKDNSYHNRGNYIFCYDTLRNIRKVALHGNSYRTYIRVCGFTDKKVINTLKLDITVKPVD